MPFFGCLQRDWNAVAQEQGATLRWVAVGHAIGAALLSEANPDFIAESIIEGGGKEKPNPWRLMKQWRKNKPVAVINLSQSVRLALAAWMSGVPIRGGDVDNHLGFLYHHRFTYRDLPMHIGRRFGALLGQLTGSDSLSWTPLSPGLLGGERGMEKLRAAGWKGEPYVTLVPGTRGYSKRWFPEEAKWPALARLLLERGYTPVWLGGPDERELVGKLTQAVPGSIDLAGQTTIPEACAVQYGAAGVVAPDTGLAHSGAALGIPIVTIVGTSSEQIMHPIGPYSLSMRGDAIEIHSAPVDFETHGSDAHRLSPNRVMAMLEVLMAERKASLESK